MKTRSLFALVVLAFGIAFGAAGCAQQPVIGGSRNPATRPPRTFALSVTLPDGGQLNAAQWAAVKSAFEQQLAAAGCTLTDNISLADKIIRVVYTPAEDDPSNGNAMVLSVRDNPAYAFNTPTSIMPMAYGSSFAYGYGAFMPSSYYYGYDDYSYGGSTVTPRVQPPGNNRPTQPIDCPPEQNHHGRSGPDHFAGSPNNNSNGSWTRNDSPRTWTPSSDGSGRTWTPSSDGSHRTWTRSDGDNSSGRTWVRNGDNSSGSSGRTWTRTDPYPSNGSNSGSGRTWTRSEPSYSSSSNSGSSWGGGSSSSSSSSSSSFSSSSSSSPSPSFSSSDSSSFSPSTSSSSSSSGGMRDYSSNQAER